MIDPKILKGLVKPHILNWDCVKLLNIRFFGDAYISSASETNCLQE